LSETLPEKRPLNYPVRRLLTPLFLINIGPFIMATSAPEILSALPLGHSKNDYASRILLIFRTIFEK
tara:strand:+ start:264137 stop:264337 length:201 start_codon:yes stop_codon:yes gene_type:complete